MSTKLYYGIRFKSRNMADILQQLLSIRKETVKLANELLTVDELKMFIVFNNLIGCNVYEIYRALINELNSDMRTLLSPNFNFTISLIPEKNGYVYGYYFADDVEEYFKKIEPLVEDYHYQNQCDKPDEISTREWNNRRKKWDKILGYDSFTQRAFNFTVVGTCDLDIILTYKKIREAIEELKAEDCWTDGLRLKFKPDTEMCYSEYPHGLFIYGNTLCFKDEYNDSYIISSGEAFWGGTKTKDERDKLIIKTVK